MTYHSIQDLLELGQKEGLPLWKIICNQEALEQQVSFEESFEQMRKMYQSMKQADREYDASLRSASGMAGGDGEKLHRYNALGKNICSDFTSLAMEKAIKMGESNACMKRIVAAPTAGSCGVIPAVFLSFEESFSTSEDTMVEALLLSAGIGIVIAENASIAGASGGCQAEIGSAAAMAAGGLVYLLGGNNEQISNGIALTIKGMLGLVCDPVCGLVEVPCIKRNVTGCVNAISASQLAMAGIQSVIPTDEVIDTMRRVGNELPACLKETAKGGLAATQTAMKMKEMLAEQ